MFTPNRVIIAFMAVASLGLTACVPPQQQRVLYHEGNNGGQQDASGQVCHTCGTVRVVDQVETRQGNTGGGAVLGAIIGGLVGSRFGGGSGQAAATAAGFLGGAMVGDSIEATNAQAASGYAWRYRVELDDGRWATVTQHNNPGFHPGDRVYVNRDHIEYMRNN